MKTIIFMLFKIALREPLCNEFGYAGNEFGYSSQENVKYDKQTNVHFQIMQTEMPI